MLVDRYPPADLFALVPEPAAACGPELRELDRPLDDDAVFQRPRADPARRAPHGLSRGRPGTPVEVVLRPLVVKRLYGWSHAEVGHSVGDSLALRRFCRVHLARGPEDDTPLLRCWADLIEPATLAALNGGGWWRGARAPGDARAQAAPRWHGGRGPRSITPERRRPARRRRARAEPAA